MNVKQLRLNTLENTRKTLARYLRAKHQGDIKIDDFKAMIQGFNVYLGYWKLIKDTKIEERLDELEAKLQEVKK